MKKADFVQRLSEKINQNKKDTTAIVDNFVALVIEVLKSGDDVVLPDMGKFLVQKRPAREAKNPMTGAIVKVPAKIVPKFRPSKKFKTEVVA
jgi:DNA-binding protein HU-beta